MPAAGSLTGAFADLFTDLTNNHWRPDMTTCPPDVLAPTAHTPDFWPWPPPNPSW